MKRVMHTFLTLFFFTQLCLEVTARITTIGVPAIQNFARRTYHASTQNWAIAQDYRGFMYFANNDGVLEYDGTSWILYQFVEPFLTRSLAAGKNGALYIGMVNEFGVARPDSKGMLVYESFRQNLPESLGDIGDVWKVHVTERGIYFQSYSYLFLFDERGKLLAQFKPGNEFRFSFLVDGNLYIQEMGRGVFVLEGDSLKPLQGLELLNDVEIWTILPGKAGELIIGTSDRGVFSHKNGFLTPWNTQANEMLISNQIFSACTMQDQAYAFGTIHDGLVITNENGELLNHLNKANGLQNNTVLSLSTDLAGNLWLGLDNGIDYVEINSAITFLYQQGGFGTGYAAAIHNGFLYLGTNNGLFATPWPFGKPGETVTYQLIPNTVGQVWYLGVHQGKLLCGHDNGAFEVSGIKVRRISDQKGAWKFIELPQYPGKLVGGTYQGLTVYKQDPISGSWIFEKAIPGFNESSRVMEVDRDGQIWMTHGFKGVYRIRVDLQADSLIDYSYFQTDYGFVTKNYINAYKIDGKVVFTAREGIFTYREDKNRFERDTLLEALFETREHISYIREDEERNIWFVAGNKPAILRFREDGIHSLIRAPYEIIHNQTVAGFEMIYPFSGEHVFFGLENGFAHYSPGAIQPVKTAFQTFVRRVETPDNTYYAGDMTPNNPLGKERVPNISYRQNSIRFAFTSPRYDGRKFVEYSYILENFSEDWSSWSLSSACEFNNLDEGLYVFRVKARDGLGQVSITDQFTFRILPPWYRSRLAWASYIILSVMVILVSVWLILKRIEMSARKERLRQLRAYRAKEQMYQHEALKAEKEIISLRNEKLMSNMIHRDKELANQTMHLIQKNKFLWKLKEELKKLETTSRDEMLRIKLGQQIKRIDREIDDANQWEVFESAFDEVHEDFLKRLKEKFPDLSPREMRLCAYLKMNISSKEIATLLNISIRGVEISRYRLRKKMGIDRDTNLVNFILEL